MAGKYLSFRLAPKYIINKIDLLCIQTKEKSPSPQIIGQAARGLRAALLQGFAISPFMGLKEELYKYLDILRLTGNVVFTFRLSEIMWHDPRPVFTDHNTCSGH